MTVGARSLIPLFHRVLVLGFLWAVSSAHASPATCPDSARSYWTSFRQATLHGGAAKVADLSRFPFIVKGTLDDSPTRKLARKQFIALLPRLLRTDPGLQPTPSTMKEFVRGHATLPDAACSADGRRFRVGEWLFEAQADHWRFVQAHLED